MLYLQTSNNVCSNNLQINVCPMVLKFKFAVNVTYTLKLSSKIVVSCFQIFINIFKEDIVAFKNFTQ